MDSVINKHHAKVYDYVNPCIMKFAPKNKLVLDVGCGTGALGRELKKNGNAVYGIEISDKSIEISRSCLDKVFKIDLESEQILPFKENEFDVIIFGDVLEHLRDPLSVLKSFKKYLKKSGRMIISLPNIANWAIRLQLLSGKFEYTSEGILDDTHVRFFTLKTAKDLIRGAGLRIEHIEAVPGAPIPVAFFPRLKYWVSQSYKSLFGNGFVFVVRK